MSQAFQRLNNRSDTIYGSRVMTLENLFNKITIWSPRDATANATNLQSPTSELSLATLQTTMLRSITPKMEVATLEVTMSKMII
ncbi:hypothetical protein AMTR_s00002p00270210 [Amborella trichopoda]|uniref:Uncharacterized protein n=1 Tax=Amborella trichopoda TaxID=13333 RepID=W1NV35_AMBTC|nr:hypothetical protein AMTR_s00002p00270210 [Amborella trichopoda]